MTSLRAIPGPHASDRPKGRRRAPASSASSRSGCRLGLLVATPASGGLDETINAVFAPIASWFSNLIFFSIEVGGAELQLIVVWLIAGAIFATVYFRFINLRGFVHALRLVRGDYSDPDDPGEVSHFQALATAVSGTVGVGNISHVAIAISVGGPGATFWMIVAGLLGMSSKFVECTLGVMYRRMSPDGRVAGGPMHYLERGFADRGLPRIGRWLARYYAVCIVIGCLGIGSMFQSNQAFVQFVNITGGDSSFFAGRGWLFGAGIALLVGVVVIGGIRSIARVTGKLVPFMAILYCSTALLVILSQYREIPWAIGAIIQGAFRPEAATGGAIAVMILGFRRAAFSNEAGIGSASIAHSAVRTQEPITEGLVSTLEPFIDTVVVCTLTALVIILTVYEPGMTAGQASGVELTSSAFASVISWFPVPLAVVVMLFAFSTMIAWSYYGLTGWLYLFGDSPIQRTVFNSIFCLSVAAGCATQLQAILDFSDALVFAMALANVLAIYLLAPYVRTALDRYWREVRPALERSRRDRLSAVQARNHES